MRSLLPGQAMPVSAEGRETNGVPVPQVRTGVGVPPPSPTFTALKERHDFISTELGRLNRERLLLEDALRGLRTGVPEEVVLATLNSHLARKRG